MGYTEKMVLFREDAFIFAQFRLIIILFFTSERLTRKDGHAPKNPGRNAQKKGSRHAHIGRPTTAPYTDAKAYSHYAGDMRSRLSV